jgi:hypothetical protein
LLIEPKIVSPVEAEAWLMNSGATAASFAPETGAEA